jgi:hypothetical protein
MHAVLCFLVRLKHVGSILYFSRIKDDIETSKSFFSKGRAHNRMECRAPLLLVLLPCVIDALLCALWFSTNLSPYLMLQQFYLFHFVPGRHHSQDCAALQDRCFLSLQHLHAQAHSLIHFSACAC